MIHAVRTGVLTSFVLVVFFVASPVFASHTNDQEYGNDTIDEYTDWLKSRSSTVKKRISNLDDDPVEEFAIPILFGVSLSDVTPNFGVPRGGGTRTHEGLDMIAPVGTPIVSPTEAVVVHITDGPSSGKTVYTANPGGETFAYLHLDSIADFEEGDALKKGDVIGYVGDTGNAKGFPHLHFEVRDGAATDPYPRVQKEFDLEDKIEFLEDVLDDVRDEDEFAEFLVEEFGGTFLLAEAQDIELPKEIKNAMKDANLSGSLEDIDGTLQVGDESNEVVTLQTFLMTANAGSAARTLSDWGATGYFGSLTKAALIEYQELVGVTPSNGMFTGRIIDVDAAANDSEEKDEEVESPDEKPKSISLGVIASVANTDLRVGDDSVYVQLVQLLLMLKNTGPAARELLVWGPTGYYGPLTRAAVREYQTENGLPVTGVYDEDMRAHIAADK